MNTTNHPGSKCCDDIGEALANPSLTVGAIVEYDMPRLAAANLGTWQPNLSAVWVDDEGRFWKEVTRGGPAGLVCVLDLRQLSHAISSDPA